MQPLSPHPRSARETGRSRCDGMLTMWSRFVPERTEDGEAMKRYWLLVYYDEAGLTGRTELWDDSEEPPISDDEGVYQFPLVIDFSTEYPTARIDNHE